MLPYGERIQKMLIRYQTSKYNDKVLNKPWIARILTWPIGEVHTVAWGNYTGPMEVGYLEIDAEPGDIVRIGQTTIKTNKVKAFYGIVECDGTVTKLSYVEAKRTFLSRFDVARATTDLTVISTERLLEELKRRGYDETN